MFPWTLIFQFVMEMIQNCIANGQSKESIKAQIKRPGPVAQFLLENKIREHLKMDRRQWRQKREEIMNPVYSEAAALPESAVETIYNESQQVDWFA